MFKLNRVLAGLVLLAAMTVQARAGLLIDAGPSSGLQPFLGGTYVAGTEFTTTSTLTIRSLGWLDAEGDGLLFTHKVGLWDVGTQSLLASASVTNSSATILSAQGTAKWFMENIAALVIGPGIYRVAGEVGPDTHNAMSNDKIGNGVTLTSGYVRTDFPNGGFNYPNLTFGSQAIRATASTDAVGGTSVPEPSSLVLLVIGAGMTVISRRRSN